MKKISNLYFIIIFISLITVGPFIINWLLNLSSKWGFITTDNYDAWVGYYGAIIGGALTLGGVWWTIKEQNRQRKEDLRIQYKPRFVPSSIDSRNNSKTNIDIYEETYLYYPIKNTGRGELIIKDILIHSDNFILDDSYTDLQIQPNESIQLRIKAKTTREKFSITLTYSVF